MVNEDNEDKPLGPQQTDDIKRLLEREAKAKAYRKEYYARNKERIKEYHRERGRMVSEMLSGAKKRQEALPGAQAPDHVIIGFTRSELDSMHLLFSSLIEEGKLSSPYFEAIFNKLDLAKTSPEEFQIENFTSPTSEESSD